MLLKQREMTSAYGGVRALTERELADAVRNYLKGDDKLENKIREAKLDLYVLRNGYGDVPARSHMLPFHLITSDTTKMYLKSLSKNKEFLGAVNLEALPYDENKEVLENSLLLAYSGHLSACVSSYRWPIKRSA